MARRYPFASAFYELRNAQVIAPGQVRPRALAGVQLRAVRDGASFTTWTTEPGDGGLRRAAAPLAIGSVPAWPGRRSTPAEPSSGDWQERLEAARRAIERRLGRSAVTRAQVTVESIDRVCAHHDGSARAWREWRNELVIATRHGAVVRAPAVLDVEEAVEELARARAFARARAGGLRGKMPIILAPGEGSVLFHEIVGHVLEADQVLVGHSPLTPGRAVAIDELTIRDAGDAGTGRDDEGERARDVCLIDRGVVRGMLLDRLCAAIAGAKSTGNGRRSDFRKPARPRMRHLIVEAGPHDPDALCGGITHGLRIERFQQGKLEIRAGRFTIAVELAREIRRGRPGPYRRGLRVTGDVLTTLSAIEGVGRDVRACPSPISCGKGDVVTTWLSGPTIRIGPLEVDG